MLENHLKLSLALNDEAVLSGPLNNTIISAPPNKIIISLVNIERETAGGINFNYQNIAEGHSQKNLPSWQLNMFVLFSAVFADKQYEESLQILSETLHFLQRNKNYNIPETNVQLAVEPVNLSFNELSNLWSICGGTYYPSILCKIRTIHIHDDEITKLSKPIMTKKTGHEQN